MGVNGTYHAEFNNVSNIGHLQDDGAAFQLGTNTMICLSPRYNWLYNMVKMGMRFDGSEFDEPFAAKMINGTIRYNVAWNNRN